MTKPTQSTSEEILLNEAKPYDERLIACHMMLDAVPVNDEGQETDMELHSEGAGVIAIAPYPFRRDPLSFSVMARRVPKKDYASDQEFRKALAVAQYFPLRFTMRARRASGFSQAARV